MNDIVGGSKAEAHTVESEGNILATVIDENVVHPNKTCDVSSLSKGTPKVLCLDENGVCCDNNVDSTCKTTSLYNTSKEVRNSIVLLRL